MNKYLISRADDVITITDDREHFRLLLTFGFDENDPKAQFSISNMEIRMQDASAITDVDIFLMLAKLLGDEETNFLGFLMHEHQEFYSYSMRDRNHQTIEFYA